MINKKFAFNILLFTMITTSFIMPVYAVSLDAHIDTTQKSFEPNFGFPKQYVIDYPQNSKIANLLQNKKITYDFDADQKTLGVSKLVDKINNSLQKNDYQNARISDLKLRYGFSMIGSDNHAVFTVYLIMMPTVVDFASNNTAQNKIDMNWRIITLDGPIMIENEKFGMMDINRPMSYFENGTPEITAILKETQIRQILSEALVNSVSISDKIETWNFDLIDNENKSKKISSFILGPSPFANVPNQELVQKTEFSYDAKYTFAVVEKPNRAFISIDRIAKPTIIKNIWKYQKMKI